MRPVLRIASVAAAIGLLSVACGCGNHRGTPLGIANQPPTVTLTSMRAATSGAGGAAHVLRWTGLDPDGRVDHYDITADARSIGLETGWVRADGTGRVVAARRSSRALGEDESRPLAPTFFAVRAVDEKGAMSTPAVRAFFGDNVAPEVQITEPWPNIFYSQIPTYVTSTFRVTWRGNDPDGAVPARLAKYKFKLLGPGSEFPVQLALTDPDSLRRFYAPGFAGWDSVPGESLGVRVSGLQDQARYVFALVGFDDAGDYSPVFSLRSNLLVVQVWNQGPRVTVSGSGAFFEMPSGYLSPDSLDSFVMRSPARAPVDLSWSARPAGPGAHVAAFRWAVDIADVNDERQRRFPLDVARWSRWSLTSTSATVTPLLPLPPKSTRRLFIEALDSNGFKSRVIVRVEFLNVRRDRPTLVVLDTRLQPESKLADGTTQPVGDWPNRAELDSFLVARGGVPMQGYPGFTSAPGLLSGYDFDIFRTMTTALDKTVPLELLMRYRNVVWITDANVRQLSPIGGAYALRHMSAPGRFNPLLGYVKAGGRLWVVGGGGAYGMSKDLFDTANNNTFTFTYSSATAELVPGRPMWELARWRSEFSNWSTTSRVVTRTARIRSGSGGSDYSGLPAALTVRSAATDPVPPRRSPPTFFPLTRSIVFEYLTQPNVITENVSPWPRRPSMSVLDTLYTVRGVHPPGVDLPCMTVYRGNDGGQVVFTGFDLWSWARPQARALVDAVLRDLWHMAPTTEAAGVATLDDTGTGEEDTGIAGR